MWLLSDCSGTSLMHKSYHATLTYSSQYLGESEGFDAFSDKEWVDIFFFIHSAFNNSVTVLY